MSTETGKIRSWNLEAAKPPLGLNPEFPWRSHASLAAGGVPNAGDMVTDKCRIIVMRFAANANAMGAYHIHHHCDNFYYLLSGTMTSVIGGVRFQTRAGQGIFMPRNVPHATGNLGGEEVYLWEIYNPSTALPDGTNDSHPVELPANIPDSRSGDENGVRIWDLADLSPAVGGSNGWSGSRLLAGGGHPDAPDQVTDKTEIALRRYAGGAAKLEAYHRHAGSDEIWVVTKGTLTTWVDGERHETTAGDVIFVPAGSAHACGNFGPAELLALQLHAPTTWIGGRQDYAEMEMPSSVRLG
jgi:mannose-6-phosphate isomerase-like protein (cupin superfamily)